MAWGFHDQYGHIGQAHDLLGNATDERAPEMPIAVAGQHDEVCAGASGSGEHLFVMDTRTGLDLDAADPWPNAFGHGLYKAGCWCLLGR